MNIMLKRHHANSLPRNQRHKTLQPKRGEFIHISKEQKKIYTNQPTIHKPYAIANYIIYFFLVFLTRMKWYNSLRCHEF